MSITLVRRRPSTRRSHRTPVVLLAAVAAALGGTATASAGVGVAVVPGIPVSVTVGDTALPVALQLTNVSANLVGEVEYDTDSYRVDDVTLVPSCGSPAFGADCAVGSRDPGVLVPRSTGLGRAGTACGGVAFTISSIDPVQGKYRFSPATPILLGPSVSALSSRQCVVDYTVDVRRSPAIDSSAVTGLQTDQTAFVQVTSLSAGAHLGQTGGGIGTARTTVLRARPSIATVASPGVDVGGRLTDQATVSGLQSPVAGSTVTFALYPPSAGPQCSGAPVATSTVPAVISGSTATATSAAYEPTVAGTYRWIATFDGDANNAPISGVCDEATETRQVTAPADDGVPAPPKVTPPTPDTPAPRVETARKVCVPAPAPVPSGGTRCPGGVPTIQRITGCVSKAFDVRVTGTTISKVVFRIDGKAIKTLKKPTSGTAWLLRITAAQAGKKGRHRVTATVTYAGASSRSKTLTVAYSPCRKVPAPQVAETPRFTG
ncbi:hypothetical protein AB0L40_14180 [Patulibacter sp. NPDC049589]|uniref:hypothetical protein n=1 Tax=Patulibacter sp. NPDC049589 TaxID=3154731 RepID=UPI003434BBEA